MLVKTLITLEMKGIGPFMVQVTFVFSPCGVSANWVMLDTAIGSMNSSLMVTLVGAA